MTTLYCTVQDVRNALTAGGQATEAETPNSTGESAAKLEDWQIEDAIVEAQTLVDMYILRRYQIINADVDEPKIGNDGKKIDPVQLVTVNVAPEPIRRWTRSLAAWFATLTYRKGKDLEERDPVELRRLQVLRSLEAVANGNYNLQLPLSDNPATDGGAEGFNLYDGDLFTLDDFGLVQDPGGRQVRVPSRWPWW